MPLGTPGVLTHTLIDDVCLASDLSAARECLTAGDLPRRCL